MTDQVSGKFLGVGARYAAVYGLNASGTPAAISTTAYYGLVISGPQSLETNFPDARQIVHTGRDNVLGIDALPPIENPTVTLRAARLDFNVYALLTGTNVLNEGEASFVGVATDRRGSEPQLGMLIYQQGLDENGDRCWQSYIMPKAKVYPKFNGMNANASENVYQIVPMVVKKHIWGMQFALATEGYRKAQVLRVMTRYKPTLCSFLADGTAVDFSFDADIPALDTTKYTVYENGVKKTSGITKSLTKVTYAAAPALSTRIDVFYEADIDPDED